MNCRSDWELSIATPEDAPGIKKVFDDGDFKGGISVKFSRDPDPYLSLQNDGEHVVLPVAKDAATGEILGAGGCVVREGYVNGGPRNTGYLTGLKILRGHRGRLDCVKQAYQLIGDRTAAYTPFYYTTILKSNAQAIKLLEKRRKGMPPYIYLGEYTVFCFGTGGPASGWEYSFKRGHTEELAAFYKKHLPDYNLAPKSELLYGLRGDDFYYLRSPGGAVLAAGAVWNQQSYKQYTISGYSGVYKALSRLPTGWLGYPKMPQAGTPANYASIAALVIPQENRDIARLFLRLLLREAKQYDFAMLGLFENHPLTETARKLRHIKYQSRLYAVDYAGNADSSGGLDGRPVMLEVGLL